MEESSYFLLDFESIHLDLLDFDIQIIYGLSHHIFHNRIILSLSDLVYLNELGSFHVLFEV